MVKKVCTFRAVIEPDEPSGYHGYVPALPGCHTCGDTIEEMREHLKEAIVGYLETALEHGDPIPQDAGIEFFQPVAVEKADHQKVKVAALYA